MSYLFVEGGVVGALVEAPPLVPPESDWLQPVTTPNVKPSSTIRVYNLFIVGVTFTKRSKRTSKMLSFVPG